jgi:glycosyltransferase involved in cell wall biosynthesis
LPLKRTLVLGNVASQSRKKNQIQLLQAVKNLVEIIPLHLFIIGSPTPSTSSELRQYLLDFSLSSHVTILNAQPNIEDYYKKFHVFVLSSFYEGCPNVLFEAMLSKCLCIVSDGANSDNYIKDGVNGLVYNGELMALEAKIRQAFMLIKSGRSDKIVETGQSYAAANFNVERMVEGYEHLYYRIAEDN